MAATKTSGTPMRIDARADELQAWIKPRHGCSYRRCTGVAA